MSSLVSEFIINPVLRQARRFSEISRSTFGGDGELAEQSAIVTGSEAVSDSENGEEHLAGATPTLESPQLRPLTSSTTQEPRLGEATILEEAAVVADPTIDHLGFPISPPRPGGPIPEDDGMRSLRGRIHAINAKNTSASEKARDMYDLLSEGYRTRRKASIHVEALTSPESLPQIWGPSASPPGHADSLKFWKNPLESSTPEHTFALSETDIIPTYARIRQPRSPNNEATAPNTPPASPNAQPPLGCRHYERNVKVECSTCKKWHPCVFCHDEVEDHNLIRKDTKHMLCMICATPQKAGDTCAHCGELAARYYCDVCKLWENRATKPIYHCEDCGICRRGLGLGKDFFHCKTCRACITTSIESSHKCIERSTDCDCPICGEYMFTSPKKVVFMKCGHSIHKKCYDAHLRVSYKCPLCSKSLVNMESQFRNLDIMIMAQPMPVEFRDTKATILCNDCSAKSTVPYHWLGLKCCICRSYNTAQLQLTGRNNEEITTEESGSGATGEPAPAGELQDQPTQAEANNGQLSSRSRNGSTILNRRRHSSHAAGLAHEWPDRIARSLSPPHVESSILSRLAMDSEEEDEDEVNIFGFWRQGDSSTGEEDDDGEDEDGDSNYGYHQEDDDDDDDDDDDIILIGHR